MDILYEIYVKFQNPEIPLKERTSVQYNIEGFYFLYLYTFISKDYPMLLYGG